MCRQTAVSRLVLIGLIVATAVFIPERLQAEAPFEVEMELSFIPDLKLYIDTPVELSLDRHIPLEPDETLGVVTTFSGEGREAVLAKFRIINVDPKDNSIRIDGESVYAKGEVRLKNGETVVVTNAIYQYIPQLNYQLEHIAELTGLSESLILQASYRAYGISDTLMKVEMRHPNDFFHINAGGFYICIGDLICGNKGDSLTGIGITPSQKAKSVIAEDKGYVVTMDGEGNFMLKGKGVIKGGI